MANYSLTIEERRFSCRGIVTKVRPVHLRIYDEADIHTSRRFVRPGATAQVVAAGHDLLIDVQRWAPIDEPPPMVDPYRRPSIYRLRLPLHVPCADGWRSADWPDVPIQQGISVSGVCRWRPYQAIQHLSAAWILEVRAIRFVHTE